MTTRRGFFKLIAGAAIAPVAAKAAALMPSAPILWGDGVHDDTEALQALLDGRVVEFVDASMAQGAGWSGDYFRMPNGIFRTTAPIRMGSEDGPVHSGKVFDGNYSQFNCEGGHHAIELRNFERFSFYNFMAVPT